jgi:hypothetical protein
MVDTILSQDLDKYLLIISSGTVITVEDFMDLDVRTSALISESKHNRVIVDERNVQHENSTLTILKLVEHMIEQLPRELRQLKLALVVDQRSKELARFWENCCYNRGYNWKAFTEMDQAVAYINQQ